MSSASKTGDSASLARSQSSIVIAPSGRSAITWTVAPAEAEIFTLTSLRPRSRSTGAAIRPTRRASPASSIRRGSSSAPAAPAASDDGFSTMGLAAIKKSGSRPGPTLKPSFHHSMESYETLLSAI